MAIPSGERRVAVLLSTFNGAAYLAAQLDSLVAQSHDNWTLYWRDDGSSDATIDILAAFAARAGQGRCVRIGAGEGWIGATESFLRLLRTVAAGVGEDDVVAFADQDDVWLPDKLSRGLAALSRGEVGGPALYCARQMLVDAALRPLAESAVCTGRCGFPAALAQNIATGCTLMLNREAALLVAESHASHGALHDWWCYLMVTAAGGCVVRDARPVVLYRQHGGNMVGAPSNSVRRLVAACRRGPAAFMARLRMNVTALAMQPHLLSEPARRDVAVIARALEGSIWGRLAALRLPGLVRETWPETMLFRCWFLLG